MMGVIGGGGGWWPIIRESLSGAWQRGITAPVQDALTHPTFWSCVTLIAGDISKLRLKLIQEDTDDICDEVDNPAYSPVLRKPNHFQNRIQFYMYWLLCKLTRGNAYALKERDARGVVTALYLLDPTRVTPMVAPNRDVFYALGQDVLAGVTEASVIVPAREIIHDLWYALYHPLVGLSPVYACGHAALQGLEILKNTTLLFKNGSLVGGVLTAPAAISNEVAERIQKHWDDNYAGPQNVGKVAVLGDGLTFQKPPVMSAVDAQLIDQLKWADEKICSTFHVPAYMVGVGAPPNYNNIEALNQQYYSQCLQILIESLELCLKEGLAIADPLYIEADLDGLLRMDSATKMKTATDGVKGGIYTPNEGRQLHNKKPLTGGDTVFLQDQDHAIEWLYRRDQAALVAPPAPPTPTRPTGTPAPPPATGQKDVGGCAVCAADCWCQLTPKMQCQPDGCTYCTSPQCACARSSQQASFADVLLTKFADVEWTEVADAA